jgi:hypothetical protein
MPKSKAFVKSHTAKLAPQPKTSQPVLVSVDDTARLKEVTALVVANNKSTISTEAIVCQIYMESRFKSNASGEGSTAKGLMQILKGTVRELYRLDNLKKAAKARLSEQAVNKEADNFFNSTKMTDDATNIQIGTRYLQELIDRQTKKKAADPIAEAYKDYRGLRNGIYYKKISAAAAELKKTPDSMKPLLEAFK